MEKLELPLAALTGVVGLPVEKLQEFFIDKEKQATAPEGETHYLEGEALIAAGVNFLKSEQERFKGIGRRSRGEEIETFVRTEFGIQDTAQGEALFKKAREKERAEVLKYEAELKTAKAELEAARTQTPGAPKPLEGDALKVFVANSDYHKQTVEELQKELENREKAHRKALQQYEERDMLTAVRREFEVAIKEYNPNISGTPDQVKGQIDLAISNWIQAYDWKKVGEEWLPYEKGRNEQAVNSGSQYVKVYGLVMDKAARLFPRNAADPNKSAPGQPSGKTTNGYPDLRGKTVEEAFTILKTFDGKSNYADIEEYISRYVDSL